MLGNHVDLQISGSEAARAAYARAVDLLLRLRPEVASAAAEALERDPGCVMATALRAYLGLTSSEAGDARRAIALVSEDLVGQTSLERGHLAAIRSWGRGDWRGASRCLDEVLDETPTDGLALFVGHQLDFFLGDAANLRGRVERALRRWDPSHPNHGFIQGQLAFGLEEAGDLDGAERAGLAALDAHEDDVWAIHAVSHVHEMRGHVAEGLAFLEARRPHWANGNLLGVHVAWHEALLRLDTGKVDEVLDLYDTAIRPPDGGEAAMELLDATSLLWRLRLDGIDTGDRWGPLADAWSAAERDAATGSGPESWYVFNDLHAVMALVGAGRQAQAEGLVERLAAFAREGDPALTNQAMVAAAGLAAARGLAAFGRGDHHEVVAALAPVGDHLSIFGGSHAQRDVFQRTLLVSASRAGETAYARRLAEARLAARPSSAWARARLAELAA
jgi:hypothetical protein